MLSDCLSSVFARLGPPPCVAPSPYAPTSPSRTSQEPQPYLRTRLHETLSLQSSVQVPNFSMGVSCQRGRTLGRKWNERTPVLVELLGVKGELKFGRSPSIEAVPIKSAVVSKHISMMDAVCGLNVLVRWPVKSRICMKPLCEPSPCVVIQSVEVVK
jgi:hypothetical protein